MAEHDDDLEFDESPDDTPLIKRLRQQLKQQSQELAGYRQKERASVFEQAGFDPNSGLGKLVAKGYEGELDPEKIREWAAAEGLPLAEPTGQQTVDAQADERAATTARVDELRQVAAPVGAQKLAPADFARVQAADPAEAKRLSDAGLVERSPIAQLLNG